MQPYIRLKYIAVDVLNDLVSIRICLSDIFISYQTSCVCAFHNNSLNKIIMCLFKAV